MSPAQQQASRTNGAKSIGPVTTQGKARSAQNSTRHGLTGGPVVLPNESQELFDELRLSYYNHYRPTTDMECSLIEEMAESRWRMRRLSVLEAAILNQACEAQMEQMGAGSDQEKAMAKAFVEVAENSKAWRMLERYQRTLRRAYEKARAELDELRSELADDMVAAERLAAGHQAALERKATIENKNKQNEPGAPASAKPNSAFLNAVLPYVKKQNEPARQAKAA